MSGQEIKYVDLEMENSKGNLKTLNDHWCSLSLPPKSITSKSIGNVAEKVNENCEKSNETSTSVASLLANSISFFNEMSITYKEADDKCAEAINKEAGKYGIVSKKPSTEKKSTKKNKTKKAKKSKKSKVKHKSKSNSEKMKEKYKKDTTFDPTSKKRPKF